MEQRHDNYEVSGLVVMTSRDLKKVPESIVKSVGHVVVIGDYTSEQLELVILQRLKYAHIDYEDEYILSDIVRYGEENLQKSIWFLRTCIAVMQAEGRQTLLKGDIVRASRLNRLTDVDDAIPF